jgi:hypothetical protein
MGPGVRIIFHLYQHQHSNLCNSSIPGERNNLFCFRAFKPLVRHFLIQCDDSSNSGEPAQFWSTYFLCEGSGGFFMSSCIKCQLPDLLVKVDSFLISVGGSCHGTSHPANVYNSPFLVAVPSPNRFSMVVLE